MKHKHYDMIVAKAANTDLCAFYRYKDNEWEEAVDQVLVWDVNADYFLCLPQHKEACLHWLNGGEVQVSFPHVGIKFGGYTCCTDGWDEDLSWMDENAVFRIKPRQEKRWIIVDAKTNNTSFAYSNKEVALGDFKCAGSSSQLIEIEVEI